MTKDPTPLQTLVLWDLLARGGAALTRDIGPGGAPDRAALKTLGLILETRVKRAKRFEVTETGWAWAAQHLDAEISTRSAASGPILRAWLTRLKLFLAAHPDIALATVLSPPQSSPRADARSQVRAAYLAVTGGKFNMRALLRDLRKELADMGRAELDAELLRMQSEDGVSLMPRDNRAAITPADEAAAILIGGEPQHLLWITR